MNRSFSYSLPLVCMLLSLSTYACMEEDEMAVNSTTQATPKHTADESNSPCVLAQKHVNECLDFNESLVSTCDEEVAQQLLEMDCQDLQAAAEDRKADGTSWLDRLHCRMGVLHFCAVPACEEESNYDESESCIQALDFNSCAQCSYYKCLEEEAQCGPTGYLIDFVGKYCTRFMQVTYPRLSVFGQVWMDGVRECLIYNMDTGYEAGESCESIEKRGIDDHITCYVNTGICSLPLGDWVKILSTISPTEFPFMQAIMVGNECIKDWFKW